MGRSPAWRARTVALALTGALAALAGCGGAPTGPIPGRTRSSRPISAQRSRRSRALAHGWNRSSTSARRSRILLVGFDVPSSVAPKPQLAALRQVYTELRSQGVRLLRVTLSGKDLAPLRVAVQGHVISYPLAKTAELAKEVYQLAGGGLAYTLIVDSSGRVAASLVGTSDRGRLQETVEKLLATG